MVWVRMLRGRFVGGRNVKVPVIDMNIIPHCRPQSIVQPENWIPFGAIAYFVLEILGTMKKYGQRVSQDSMSI
jgi:hypothetical protein